MESVEPSYGLSAIFFMISLLLFLVALSFFPFTILLALGQFNIFFCLGSVSMQLSLAFYFAPMVYIRRILFSNNYRIVAAIYLLGLILDLYFIILGSRTPDYFTILWLISVQALSLVWFIA